MQLWVPITIICLAVGSQAAKMPTWAKEDPAQLGYTPEAVMEVSMLAIEFCDPKEDTTIAALCKCASKHLPEISKLSKAGQFVARDFCRRNGHKLR